MRAPPSGRVPKQGPDWFFVATEACGGGTPDLFCFPMVLGYIGIYRRKKYVRGATRAPRGWRARPGGVGAPPYLVSSSFVPWSRVQVSWITFGEKIMFPKILFRLDSV